MTVDHTMTILTELAISNLLSFDQRGVRIALRPLSVLIGANGAGKSNVLRALAALASPTESVKEDIWRHVESPPDAVRSIQTRMKLGKTGRSMHRSVELKSVDHWLTPDTASYQADDGLAITPEENASALNFHRELHYSRETKKNERVVASMAWNVLTPQEQAQVASQAQEVDSQLAGIDRDDLEVLLFQATGPAPLGTGTLRFVRRLAEIAGGTGRMTIIENPESGLHDDAVCALGERLVEASGTGQYIVKTHSGAFVSTMNETPENVLVCEHDGTKTSVEPLNLNQVKPYLESEGLNGLWSRGAIGGTRW